MCMNEVYKVVQTRRKGFGCIATQDIKRKTLILTEEAQIETHNKNPRNKEHAKEMVKANIEIAVGKILGSLGEKSAPGNRRSGVGLQLENLHVQCDHSLRIKMSRFNHSSRPNAVVSIIFRFNKVIM